LGVAFEQGTGTPQNYKLAAEWYQRAADQGSTEALVNLGTLYDYGMGVDQDHARAITLYRKAIEVDDHSAALFNLGLSYFKGTAVEMSVPMALSFYKRAAALGHARAEYRVGRAYMEGDGGYAKDIEHARKYIKASAAQGDDDAVALLHGWNACAHCGTAFAPKVCSGCITTRYCRYCDAKCQLAQWRARRTRIGRTTAEGAEGLVLPEEPQAVPVGRTDCNTLEAAKL
jgi:tetratricopeptide (TPR) repeat protein